MQTTLRIDDVVYRKAKAQAAKEGTTLTRFIEEALKDRISRAEGIAGAARIRERNELMESLLKKTAHFRVGPKPTRVEANER